MRTYNIMINVIASVGDVIKWIYDGIPYLAEVEHITEDCDYCVYVTYVDHGYTQDYISTSDIVSVYVKR